MDCANLLVRTQDCGGFPHIELHLDLLTAEESPLRMGRTLPSLLSAIALLLCASQSLRASLVAGWNFNSYNGSDTSIAADHGTGTLSIAAGFSLDKPAGTTVNAVIGDAAGTSLSLFHANGTIDLTFSMAGLSNAQLSWATKVDTGSGHENNTLSYSLDNGATFTTILSNIMASTTFSLATFNLPAVVDNAAVVKIRYTLLNSSGNHGTFLDNIQIVSGVPEASSFGMGSMVCGLVGVLAARKRNR
jgi:hypothetical protein